MWTIVHENPALMVGVASLSWIAMVGLCFAGIATTRGYEQLRFVVFLFALAVLGGVTALGTWIYWPALSGG